MSFFDFLALATFFLLGPCLIEIGNLRLRVKKLEDENETL